MHTLSTTQRHARIIIKRIIKWNAAAISSFRPGGPTGIAVLTYHRVNGYRRNELSVTPEMFRRQVRWLRDNGYENMRMSELADANIENRTKPDAPHVVFSFDDGYEDNYTEAFPVLKEHGYTAIFYLATDYMGGGLMYPRDILESNSREHNRVMSWEQASELLASGMEIGSHTISHPVLTRIPDEQACREIKDSRIILEEKLEVPVTSFCYPGGFLNETHRRYVREAGYHTACAADPGIWQGGDVFRIPRVSVLASDGFFVFRKKVSGQMEWFRAIH